ncbi:MAG: glycosyltransferase family 4 protein [Nanoarchaeota archaeon]|nr:glycosyltransferase family 4 protein [Nanoarchaeota archaeon]
MKRKLKILELTNFSAGICGVWQRVKQESMGLSRVGHEVRVFSSNAVKGSKEIAEDEESLGNIKIRRFPFKNLGGESFMSWNFERESIEYSPEVIIAHSYRHAHTLNALKVRDKLKKQGKKCRVFLVTHAPFVDTEVRGFAQSIIVKIYDFIVGRNTLKKFDKVIAITNWEIQYLVNLGVKKERISYVPNGIPEEFFKETKLGKGIFFLGRISPVKNIETIIRSMKNVESTLDIIGPAEENYKKKLMQTMESNGINNVRFLPAVYDLKKKISLIDRYEIFVLPSITESMPQSLIEAMARGKICISSKTKGGKEIIKGGKNGFLFEIGNIHDLKEKINLILKMPEKEKKRIRKEAIKTAEKFKLSKIINDLGKLF